MNFVTGISATIFRNEKGEYKTRVRKWNVKLNRFDEKIVDTPTSQIRPARESLLWRPESLTEKAMDILMNQIKEPRLDK